MASGIQQKMKGCTNGPTSPAKATTIHRSRTKADSGNQDQEMVVEVEGKPASGHDRDELGRQENREQAQQQIVAPLAFEHDRPGEEARQEDDHQAPYKRSSPHVSPRNFALIDEPRDDLGPPGRAG